MAKENKVENELDEVSQIKNTKNEGGQIDITDLRINQKVWLDGKEHTIVALGLKAAKLQVKDGDGYNIFRTLNSAEISEKFGFSTVRPKQYIKVKVKAYAIYSIKNATMIEFYANKKEVEENFKPYDPREAIIVELTGEYLKEEE